MSIFEYLIPPVPSEEELRVMYAIGLFENEGEISPPYLRLHNLVPTNQRVHTLHLDDVQCFIEWTNLCVNKGVTSFHVSPVKYFPPVDIARIMLEMTWGIENGTIKTTPYLD